MRWYSQKAGANVWNITEHHKSMETQQTSVLIQPKISLKRAEHSVSFFLPSGTEPNTRLTKPASGLCAAGLPKKTLDPADRATMVTLMQDWNRLTPFSQPRFSTLLHIAMNEQLWPVRSRNRSTNITPSDEVKLVEIDLIVNSKIW